MCETIWTSPSGKTIRHHDTLIRIEFSPALRFIRIHGRVPLHGQVPQYAWPEGQSHRKFVPTKDLSRTAMMIKTCRRQKEGRSQNILEAGDLAPADVRLVESNNLRVNEAALTGEYVAGSIALCAALLIAAVYLPGLSAVLITQDPGLRGWLLVLGMSLIPFALGQGLRLAQALREPR